MPGFFLNRILLPLALLTVALPLFCGLPESLLAKKSLTDKPVPHPEAVVILAGGVEERVQAGARIFQEQKPPRVVLTNDGVLSRWSGMHQRNLFQVEWQSMALQQMGVPEAAIVQLPFTRSGTRFDAVHVRQWATDHGVKQLLLVTSEYHSRRALWTFEKVFDGTGIEIGVFPVRDVHPDGFDPVGCWSRGVVLLKEAVKLVGYRWLVT